MKFLKNLKYAIEVGINRTKIGGLEALMIQQITDYGVTSTQVQNTAIQIVNLAWKNKILSQYFQYKGFNHNDFMAMYYAAIMASPGDYLINGKKLAATELMIDSYERSDIVFENIKRYIASVKPKSEQEIINIYTEQMKYYLKDWQKGY